MTDTERARKILIGIGTFINNEDAVRFLAKQLEDVRREGQCSGLEIGARALRELQEPGGVGMAEAAE